MRPSSVVLAAAGVIAALSTVCSGAPCAPGLCTPGTGPCRIEAPCEVPEPLTIDLGGRALVIGRGVTVTVVRGPLAITAASATLEPGARVIAPDHLARGGGTVRLTVAGDLRLQSDATGQASIDVTGEFFAGTIALHAGGDIVIDGPVVAAATRFGFGGTVTVDTSGGSIELNGPIVARADSPGIGGRVTVSAPLGAISVVAPIDATGGDGGEILFEAKGNLMLAAAANLDVSSVGKGAVLGPVGFGGFIGLGSRQGNITVAASMRAAAARDENDFTGTGGDVDVVAPGGSVELLGTVDVSAPAPDGTGGGLFVLAGRDLTQRGTVLAAGAGKEGEGGFVDLEAGDVLTLGSMDLHGGFSDAGELRATSRGTVVLVASAEIDGRGTAGKGAFIDIVAPTVTVAGRLDLRSQGTGFEGGDVFIRGTTVTMAGRIDLRAQGADGSGGTVLIDACALSVPPGASIVASGAGGGLNTLIAHSSLALGGSVVAGGESGMNDVVYGFLPPPVIPPGTFDPPPRLFAVATREPCPGAMGTTTTTAPPGTSTTTTVTTTTRPVATNTATTTTAVSSTASTAPPTTLAPACASDAPAACDDGDPCTADGCVDGHCANDALPDFTDAHCRLDAVRALVHGAAPAVAGGRRFQARLDRRLIRVRDMVDAAASGRGGRAIRLLRRARRELGPVIRTVGKRHGVAPGLAARITAGAEDVRRRLRPLETLVRSRTKNA